MSNAATGNYLEGAIVQMAGVGDTACTNREGRTVFNRVPAFTVTLAESFAGSRKFATIFTVLRIQRAAGSE